ncbi:hypothetical protein D3C79_988120 [compost metagenome]
MSSEGCQLPVRYSDTSRKYAISGKTKKPITRMVICRPIKKIRFNVSTTPRLTSTLTVVSTVMCLASCSVSELVIATA